MASDELLQELDEFRHEERLATRAIAIRELLAIGLKHPRRAKRPRPQKPPND